MHFEDITPDRFANFWARVDQSTGINGCWLCRCHHQRGYPWFTRGTFRVKANRFAFISILGDPPPHLPLILHKCPGGANAWCVNPAHLSPGTDLENHADRERDGRTARGMQNGGGGKLNDTQVRAIIHDYTLRQMTLTELGRANGVSRTMIRRIVQGRNWRHLSRHHRIVQASAHQ